MPLYEFLCSDCDLTFERYVPRFRDSVHCPACGSPGVEKQLSSFAFSGTGDGTKVPAGVGGCGCGRGGCGCHH